jgi:hypothetical protein
MRLFACQGCGNAVHFDNTTCLSCGRRLGYLPERFVVTALEPGDDGSHVALADPARGAVVFCDNARHDACNWLLPAAEAGGLCRCCRHNRVVPDLSVADNLADWRKLEGALHHLFYSLMRWRLPLVDQTEAPDSGLAFDLLAEVADETGAVKPVMTGHADGVITLALAEADDATREARRTALAEPYRTLLGHFRHEIAHYYWDRLVRDGGQLEACRAIFGDDSADYGAALQRHYAEGPPADWREHFISAYASCHPWEDFAETFAHYTHMVDALETAHAYGLVVRSRVTTASDLEAEVDFDPYVSGGIDDLVAAWVPVTVAVNSLNRSMGQPDLYPFVNTPAVVEKLGFIHHLIRRAGRRA